MWVEPPNKALHILLREITCAHEPSPLAYAVTRDEVGLDVKLMKQGCEGEVEAHHLYTSARELLLGERSASLLSVCREGREGEAKVSAELTYVMLKARLNARVQKGYFRCGRLSLK